MCRLFFSVLEIINRQFTSTAKENECLMRFIFRNVLAIRRKLELTCWLVTRERIHELHPRTIDVIVFHSEHEFLHWGAMRCATRWRRACCGREAKIVVLPAALIVEVTTFGAEVAVAVHAIKRTLTRAALARRLRGFEDAARCVARALCATHWADNDIAFERPRLARMLFQNNRAAGARVSF